MLKKAAPSKTWKQQLLESAAEVFGGARHTKTEPDLRVLHAKIGQLTLENDFLEGALR
jgi:transposase